MRVTTTMPFWSLYSQRALPPIDTDRRSSSLPCRVTCHCSGIHSSQNHFIIFGSALAVLSHLRLNLRRDTSMTVQHVLLLERTVHIIQDNNACNCALTQAPLEQTDTVILSSQSPPWCRCCSSTQERVLQPTLSARSRSPSGSWMPCQRSYSEVLHHGAGREVDGSPSTPFRSSQCSGENVVSVESIATRNKTLGDADERGIRLDRSDAVSPRKLRGKAENVVEATC